MKTTTDTTELSRGDKLLQLEEAGGICMGNGLGSTIQITHTLGKEGEGRYGSFVILTIQDDHGNKVSIPFDPTWGGTLDQLIGSLRYHGREADKIRKARQ